MRRDDRYIMLCDDERIDHRRLSARFKSTKQISYLSVDDRFGNVEFTDHAKGDGTSAGLSIIKLTFKEDGIDTLFLGKDLSGASTGWSTTNDSNLVSHIQGGSRLGDIGGGLTHKGRMGESIRHSGEGNKGGNSVLHLLVFFR